MIFASNGPLSDFGSQPAAKSPSIDFMPWVIAIAIIVVVMLLGLLVAMIVAHRQVVHGEFDQNRDTNTPVDASKYPGRKRFHD